MKILPILQADYRCRNEYKSKHAGRVYDNRSLQCLPTAYYTPNFTAKPINLAAEKSRVFSQINNMLKNEEEWGDAEDVILRALDLAMKFIERKKARLEAIDKEAESVAKDRYMDRQQKIGIIKKLKKEAERIYNSKFKMPLKLKDKNKEKIDFVLLNKFKTAALEDYYNLSKVLEHHYDGLKSITTLDELKEKYPSINTPQRPENVIAEKLIDALGKDFYSDLEVAVQKDGNDAIIELLNKSFYNLIKGMHESELGQNLKEENLEKIKNEIVRILPEKCEFNKKNGYKKIPQRSGIVKPNITAEDFSLLDSDYDDFVLSVIREQYCNGKKLSDILYEKNGLKIRPTLLKNTGYKFAKFPEKIKQLIILSRKVVTKEREYDTYSIEELRTRLNFYSEKFGYDEFLLDKMISFDMCRFEDEDVKQLKLLLKELDTALDGDKSVHEISETIKAHNISPHATNKYNEAEREAAFVKMQAEQSKRNELKNKQDEFDEAINTLYKNNLNYAADICADYRPKEYGDIKGDANYLINIVKKYSDAGMNADNKEALQKEIINWNKYNEYNKSNINRQLLAKAEGYAVMSDGKVDVNKAGRYLINAELVENYPNGLEYVKDAEIIKKIMEKTSGNKELAINYICRFDEYMELPDIQKNKIGTILSIFDKKDSTEKQIIKHIVENYYVKADTKAQARINLSGIDSVESVITANAKQQILDYYKFTNSLEFYEEFEDAMTVFATNRSSSGIKNIGTNNKNRSGMSEIKIIGYPDRLFAYNGTYVFDEFSNTGIH